MQQTPAGILEFLIGMDLEKKGGHYKKGVFSPLDSLESLEWPDSPLFFTLSEPFAIGPVQCS